jgi:hypothetical protein
MKPHVPMSRLARPAALASALFVMAALAAVPVLAVSYGAPAAVPAAAPASLKLGAGSSASLGRTERADPVYALVRDEHWNCLHRRLPRQLAGARRRPRRLRQRAGRSHRHVLVIHACG